jgi:DeoR/GlpR family transcriptional regulator of sugar metabolism
VLASTDKLGAASPFTVAALNELATLVVPATVPSRIRKELQATGVNLLLVQ